MRSPTTSTTKTKINTQCHRFGHSFLHCVCDLYQTVDSTKHNSIRQINFELRMSSEYSYYIDIINSEFIFHSLLAHTYTQIPIWTDISGPRSLQIHIYKRVRILWKQFSVVVFLDYLLLLAAAATAIHAWVAIKYTTATWDEAKRIHMVRMSLCILLHRGPATEMNVGSFDQTELNSLLTLVGIFA